MMQCSVMVCDAMLYRVMLCYVTLCFAIRGIPEQGMTWMEEIEGQRTAAAEYGRLHGLYRSPPVFELKSILPVNCDKHHLTLHRTELHLLWKKINIIDGVSENKEWMKSLKNEQCVQ